LEWERRGEEREGLMGKTWSLGVTRTEDAEDREIGNVLICRVYGWVAMSGVGA